MIPAGVRGVMGVLSRSEKILAPRGVQGVLFPVKKSRPLSRGVMGVSMQVKKRGVYGLWGFPRTRF